MQTEEEEVGTRARFLSVAEHLQVLASAGALMVNWRKAIVTDYTAWGGHVSFVNVKVIQGSSSKVRRPLPVQSRITPYLVSHSTYKRFELCHA